MKNGWYVRLEGPIEMRFQIHLFTAMRLGFYEQQQSYTHGYGCSNRKLNFRKTMTFFSHRKMFRECEKRLQRRNGTCITKKGRLMHALKAVLRTVKEKNTRSWSTEEILIWRRPDINHLWQHTSERKKQFFFDYAFKTRNPSRQLRIAFKRLLTIHRNVTWHEGCW